jgi:hypothetical protein
MIMDALLLFDGAVAANGAITPTAVNSGTTFAVGATDSANVIDVSQIASSASGLGRDVGVGDDPALLIGVDINTSFAGTGATMSISLQTAPDNGSGGIGSWTTLSTTAVMAVAALTAGTRITFPIPPGVNKYLKLVYTVATANMTAGKLISSIVLDRQQPGPLLGYPSGYSNAYV